MNPFRPAQTLREAAESRLQQPAAATTAPAAAHSAAAPTGALHELQVQQIELELQNAELRSQRQEIEAQHAELQAEGARDKAELRGNRELSVLRDLESADIASFMRAATEAATRALSVARASFWLVQDDATVLHCQDRFDAIRGVHEAGDRLAAADFPNCFAALQGTEMIAADDAFSDPRTREFAPGGTHPLGVTSMLDAPMRMGGRFAGALCLEHIGPARHWTHAEQGIARALASMALHAIEQVERHNAEAAQQRSDLQLRTLLDGMAERAWLKDAQGRYLALNRAEALALGVPAQAAVGKTMQELQPGPIGAATTLEDEVAMHAPGPSRIERGAYLGDGWLEISRVPIRNEAGHVEGLVGLARDVTERKRTEQALRDSEARFRALVELSADWYWETDAQGRFTMFEISGNGVWPFTAAEFLGRTGAEVNARYGMTREQLTPTVEVYDAMMADHQSVRDALSRRVFPDGREVYLRYSIEPIFDAHGAFRGNRGVTRDVTLHEQANRQLARAHRRLALAIDGTGARIHEFDLDRNVVSISGASGGSEVAVELPWAQARTQIHPDDATTFNRLNDEIRRGETTRIDVEYRARLPGGQWKWRRMKAGMVEQDIQGAKTRCMAGTSVDISERKHAELALGELNRELEARVAQRTAALAESEARFRAVMSNAPLGILIVAPDRRITDANPRACEILGYPRERLVGTGIQAITHPDDWLASASRAAPMEAGLLQDFVLEKRYLRGDGGIVWAKLHVAAVNDAAGKHLYRISVIEDITERMQVDARSQHHAEQVSALSGRLLRAQEDERRHIARELHDEIGQVLTGVQFAMGAAEQQCAREGVEPAQIGISIGLAKRVVTDAMGRVRKMWQQLRPPVLDDLGLVAALHSLCGQHEALTSVPVVFDAQCDAAAIPPQVAEVLYRISQEALTNAARHARARRIDVRLSESQGKLVLEVRDDGAGFDTLQSVAAGHLGIVGMRERIKLLGGRLEVRSSPGAGTSIVAEISAAQTALPH